MDMDRLIEFETFKSPTYGELEFTEVLAKLEEYFSQMPNSQYELIIGTDSLLYPGNAAEFVTAIVVHRKFTGGIYFWSKRRQVGLHTLRDRIFQEALLSLRAAEKLLKNLRSTDFSQFNLVIHVDIGPNGETKKMIQEIVGMIKGNGFDVKIKPESYGASSVADRHT